jgi:hypothetical protein
MVESMNRSSWRTELWLSQRLREKGVTVDAGVTTQAERAARARNAIERNGLAEVIVGRGPDGKPMRYRQLWEHVYGQPWTVAA